MYTHTQCSEMKTPLAVVINNSAIPFSRHETFGEMAAHNREQSAFIATAEIELK